MKALNNNTTEDDKINTNRLKTRNVDIGGISLGYKFPVRLQSMTNTNTLDTNASVEQIIRIKNAGADYVRLTTPTVRDAENLANIKKQLQNRGYNIPLIADVHFNPKVAETAARVVEKIRINPGNYIDRKCSETVGCTDIQFGQEQEKIREKLLPLLKICRQYGTAIRLGVNHGSLSDRIISRYGDTSEGMVESVMEFLHICVAENFHDIVISLKSSNILVMIAAYRLMAQKMLHSDLLFPLHLGVTEAGIGEDGRIKSTIGTGILLAEGIGDTIRVSLTEPPENELPVAKQIVKHYEDNFHRKDSLKNSLKTEYNSRIITEKVLDIGYGRPPVVITDFDSENITGHKPASSLPATLPDFYFVEHTEDCKNIPSTVKLLMPAKIWGKSGICDAEIYPVFSLDEYADSSNKSTLANFIRLTITDFSSKHFEQVNDGLPVVFIFESNTQEVFRQCFDEYKRSGCTQPVILHACYSTDQIDTFRIISSFDIGALFVDGFGDGIWLNNIVAGKKKNIEDRLAVISTSFGILQATRSRITKTEYISCPSCGRTHFNLEEVTARVKERTSHLKGLKIAIMGCIVNGPGEMADADYGYVGAGKGKITLYRKKEIVMRNISSEQAVDKLLEIIKQNGDWKEENMNSNE